MQMRAVSEAEAVEVCKQEKRFLEMQLDVAQRGEEDLSQKYRQMLKKLEVSEKHLVEVNNKMEQERLKNNNEGI